MKSRGDTAVPTVKLRNHHLSLSVWPEEGRILQARSLRTGRHLLSWWPYRLNSPEEVGGIGDLTLSPGAAAWKHARYEDSITLSRSLPGGISLQREITLPADSATFSVTLTLANNSQSPRSVTLKEGAAICPGSGGACPGPDSGISNSRERAFVKRPGREPEAIYYEVFEHLHREHDDLEWAAFSDPVSDNLLCVVLPEGHVTIDTTYHWWLTWREVFFLEAGEKASVEFHYSAAGDLDLPVLASQHVIAGFRGKTAPFSRLAQGSLVIWGLDDAVAGNDLAVEADGLEIVGGKPMPAGREPLEVALPEWQAADGLSLEISIGGQFSQARLPGRRYGEMCARLEDVSSQAVEDLKSSKISRSKAASVMALKKIIEADWRKCSGLLGRRLEDAYNDACDILTSTRDVVPLYSEAERSHIMRLAESIDKDEAVRLACERLGRDWRLSEPRFREADSSVGAPAAAGALHDAALVLMVAWDEQLLELFRKTLGEFTRLWETYGQVMYETIHHGVLLCKLIGACKLAFEGGWIDIEEEVTAQAMIIDLTAKIKRQGGRQFRLSNWWAMESAGPAWLGALFPYMPGAREYRNAARETFYWLLAHGTLSDGGFWEMSPSYHVVTLTYLHQIAEALLRSGVDLYGAEVAGRKLREMTDYLKTISCPPGALPAFDDSGRSVSGQVLMALAKRLQDGELTFHAQRALERSSGKWPVCDLYVPLDSPEPVEPRRKSEVLVPSGKLILRSACRKLSFIFDFGPHGGWHGHSDKLSFEAFWGEMCIVPDAGSYRYEDALHWEWFKTAPAHNTVTLGERDRVQAEGRLLYFEEGRDFLTAGMTAPLSDGASHRREVTLADRALIIDDFVEGARKGETLVWRMNSYAPIELKGDTAVLSRSGVEVHVSTVSKGVGMDVARVPLMGEKDSPAREYVNGWQLRLSSDVEGNSQRVLVKLDFAW